MYQDSKRTCTVIVLLIKPFLWWRSRRRCRRGFVNSLINLRGRHEFQRRSSLNIREFTKPRRRRRGQRRVKNELIFYLRISRYSKVIYFVYHCQNYLKSQ